MDGKLLISVEEMTEVLGVSRAMAYRLAHSEGFPIVRLGRRRLVPVDLLKEWLAAQTTGGKKGE